MNCFHYRAGSEGDKWEGFARGHFYNDIMRAKRISIAILFMPRRGKNKVAGLVFLWFLTLFKKIKKNPFLSDGGQQKEWWWEDLISA